MIYISAEIYPGAGGELIGLASGDIVSYRIRDALCTSGLPLGAASSKRFELTVNKGALGDKTAPAGCRVRVRVREDGGEWRDAGVWYVEGVKSDDGSPTARIYGSDALSGLFEASFTDSAGAYPRTLRNLTETLCAAAGVSLRAGAFHNEALLMRQMPQWPEGVTLRRALSSAAFAAGGFARMNYSGECEIVSCFGGDETALTPDDYTAFTREDAGTFAFNALLYRFEGEKEYARYANEVSLTDSALNSLRAECNPLASSALIRDVATYLCGASSEGGSVSWRGGAILQAGDRLSITDSENTAHSLLITENSVTIDSGGISLLSRADMPSQTGKVSAAQKVFNSDGSLSFDAIGEVTKRVMALHSAYISQLTAGDISANGLLAKLIEAVRVKAASISASEVTTDSLTAAAAELVSASVRKLEAGTIATDAFVTALIDAFSIKAGQLTAGSISTDRLAAALARFQVIAAGSAEFDRATVNHMISSALNVSYGVGGEVFIENLAADYASIVNASVGRLCVKAADGEYYELNVQNGAVVPTRVSLSANEIADGVSLSGRPIIDTELAVSELSASGVKAARALINRLDAARIDAGTLFATRAFIDSLNARDITSNTYLRLALTDIDERLTYMGEGADEAAVYTDALRRFLTVDEDGLKQGRQGSVYSTLVNESGFHILRRGSVKDIGTFDLNGLTAQGITLGGVTARPTARGGWVWQ
ncbi:MAG: hypothetical protein II920_04185 [Clostridia bacterium]|nr:hypothetical protein [Clostridia bacterium]